MVCGLARLLSNELCVHMIFIQWVVCQSSGIEKQQTMGDSSYIHIPTHTFLSFTLFLGLCTGTWGQDTNTHPINPRHILWLCMVNHSFMTHVWSTLCHNFKNQTLINSWVKIYISHCYVWKIRGCQLLLQGISIIAPTGKINDLLS
jgi:hypothetical protein